MARRYDRVRSTVYRWFKKWHQQNPNIKFASYNRTNRPVGMSSHAIHASWNIVTLICRPKISPKALDSDLVELLPGIIFKELDYMERNTGRRIIQGVQNQNSRRFS